MKTAILIPARSGSKRITNKNIKALGGHPLMAWSILTGKELGLDTWVSTDSTEYEDIARSYGAMVSIRPDSLSTDQATDFQVIRHFAQRSSIDLIVYLRPTTPFRSEHVVQEAINIMADSNGADSLRSVEQMSESAYKCFRINMAILRPLTRTDYTDRPNQTLPQTYKPNGYVDIVKRRVIDQGSLWGAGRYAYITPRTIEIDDPEDWEYAEWWAQGRGKKWTRGGTGHG